MIGKSTKTVAYLEGVSDIFLTKCQSIQCGRLKNEKKIIWAKSLLVVVHDFKYTGQSFISRENPNSYNDYACM